MGEAKRRGTYEQRKAMAPERRVEQMNKQLAESMMQQHQTPKPYDPPGSINRWRQGYGLSDTLERVMLHGSSKA